MKNHPGLKAWSTVPAMLFSLALISGCNEEAPTPAVSPTPPSAPAPVAKTPETPKKVGEATPPPPSTPKAEEHKK